MRQLNMWNALSYFKTPFPCQPGEFSTLTGSIFFFFDYSNVLLGFEVLLGFIKSR